MHINNLKKDRGVGEQDEELRQESHLEDVENKLEERVLTVSPLERETLEHLRERGSPVF